MLMQIDVSVIKPDPSQPRQTFDKQSLLELAQSISTQGVIQPIECSPAEGGTYLIHHGERRWRASCLAGLKTIPVIVREPMADEDRFVRAVIENEQREDMRPMDRAKAYQRLITEFGYTRQKICRRVGRSEPYISNLLRWLKLEPEIQDLVNQNLLPIDRRVAEALLTIPGSKTRVALVERLTRNGKPAIPTVVKACTKLVATEQPTVKPKRQLPPGDTRQARPKVPPALALAGAPANGGHFQWVQIEEIARHQCTICPAWQPGDDLLVCRQCPLAATMTALAKES